MSLKCPYRHVSYATWRLQALRRLFLSLSTDAPTSLSGAESARWKRYSTLFRPFGGRVKEEVPAQNEPPAETPNRARRSKPNKRRAAFNPYSQEGLQKMKDLLPELKTLTEKMRNQAQANESKPPREKITIPKSPIEAQVEKAAKRRGIQKERATYKELGPLKNNPWAEMLAGPIRFCQATGARLPGDMLIDFDYVENPADDKTYLLPANLADLDALEGEMAKELYKEDWRRVRADKRAARERLEASTTTVSTHSEVTDAVEASDSEHAAASQSTSRRQSSLTRILADVNVFRILTLHLTKGKKNNPQIRVSKVGEVSKLIPFESKGPVLSAQHYVRHKKEVEQVTSTADGKTPDPAPLNFRELQWQPDIHIRLAQIMRERVRVCLQALAETSAQNDITKPAKVVALPLPPDGKLSSNDIEEFIAKASSTDQASPESARNEEGEAKQTPSAERSTKSPPSRPTTMAGKGSLLGHAEITPGSIFLHIGDGHIRPPQPQSTNSDNPATAAAASCSLPPLFNTLIPPMLTVDETYRFPIFSLHQLLADPASSTSAGIDTLNNLIQTNPIFQSPVSGEKDYLLLIRPGPGPARHVVREIWQLWRYVEGQPGVPLETDWSLEGQEHAAAGKQGDEEEDDAPTGKRRR